MKNGYIVANKEQEFDVLKKLEQEGFKWYDRDLPTKFIFSEGILFSEFPYIISEYKDIGYVGWSYYSENYDGKIVYDGRKEEKMYKVTQEFMNELVEWRDNKGIDAKKEFIDTFVDGHNIQNIPDVISDWWTEPANPIENNKRLIAIIQWLNGEDVFEFEAPHKFMIRSEHPKPDGDYSYVKVFNSIASASYFNYATKFDTREEAQEWANSHQVVIEIDEYGNEVE